MNYQVFWKSKKWEYEEDYSECDNFVKFDDLEKVNINFDDIKFSEIDSFVDFINAHLENRFVSNMDGWSVISMIY
jgi:hypothetical protein